MYSRELLRGLAATDYAEGWDWFYRSPRYWKALFEQVPQNVRVRRLSDSGGNRLAPFFHGLNQRLPTKKFRRQIATFHDLFVLSGDYSAPDFRERFAQQARSAAEAADLIIAVSAFTASQVESLLGVPSSRIHVVHHGVLPRPVLETRREEVILCVGAIQRRKNQAALVRAFRAAPPEWKLVLAGSAGYEAEAALQAKAAAPYSDRIEITGYLPDAEIGRWYSRASVFAFPSLDEGFGMPALEAMAAGIPVIAGNRSALPEICGDSALLIDPGNEGELSSAIEHLTSSESARQALAQKGIRHAANFTWKAAVEKTLAVYNELK